MRALFLFLSAILLALAWLLPFHKTPWTTFGSELLTFFAGLSFLAIFFKTPLKIPKPQWVAALVLVIPLLQWALGQILYLSNALISTGYLVMFWLMIVAGYNLSLTTAARELLFKRFCMLLIGVGLLSSLIAVLQWLHLSAYFSPYMMVLKGNRPYANFAQPNNLATFLSISTLACMYLFEKKILPKRVLIPVALLFLFTIALTQSRTSWVVCLFILAYLPLKQRVSSRFSIKPFDRTSQLGFAKTVAWVAIFVAMIIVLPYINHWVEALSHQQVIETTSVVERASSGYLRLDMWTQSAVAIGQQPWFGYGWNQTGMAQIAAIELYPTHEWYKSSHNMVLDLLIWNGIPVGALILIYLIFWLYWLNKGVKESVSIVATLMVCAILIHALLEYPIHYAYFLLPMGLLLGIIQAQYPRLPTFSFPISLYRALIVVGVVLTAVVYRDYNLYRQDTISANKQTLAPAADLPIGQQIWLLTQFKERLQWVNLDPQTSFSDQELQHLGRVVANSASKFDLYKYAQVLAFNGKKQQAQQQLWILKQLHGDTREYADLLSVSKPSH